MPSPLDAFTPGPDELSATPDRRSRAAWALMLKDSIFRELSRIREEYIRATRAGDALAQHYLIDFANELCEGEGGAAATGDEIDVEMACEGDPPQEEIEAEARRFVESLKQSKGR